MKSLVESLINKRNIKTAKRNDKDIIVFVTNLEYNNPTFILLNKELSDIKVHTLDKMDVFLIVGRPMLKKVLSIIGNVDDSADYYWGIPKDDYNAHNLNKLKELIKNTNFFSIGWNNNFEEIEFPEL